jgi:hypothetical protein
MKMTSHILLALILAGLHAADSTAAADFSVTTPGFFFNLNGSSPNPTITLVRGQTYTFAVTNASFHPFKILNSTGVVNNNISTGIITYTVPLAVANYTYECSIHHFSGTILTIAPPVPPKPVIFKLAVGTNLNLKFTGSNTFSYFPEFNTNLATTNWFALTVVQTNAAPNGTNDVICGKPPGDNVFVRVRAQ